MARDICEIAEEIESDWTNPDYRAVPYLIKMGSLYTIWDNYNDDSGLSIVCRFLQFSTKWNGNNARRIKRELKAIALG